MHGLSNERFFKKMATHAADILRQYPHSNNLHPRFWRACCHPLANLCMGFDRNLCHYSYRLYFLVSLEKTLVKYGVFILSIMAWGRLSLWTGVVFDWIPVREVNALWRASVGAFMPLTRHLKIMCESAQKNFGIHLCSIKPVKIIGNSWHPIRNTEISMPLPDFFIRHHPFRKPNIPGDR